MSLRNSVLTRATWRNIPEDDILHSHRRKKLKSYIALTGWTLWRGYYAFLVRYGLHTVYLCVQYGSHNKQRLFTYTALTGWAL
jgi:hypothetical protein